MYAKLAAFAVIVALAVAAGIVAPSPAAAARAQPFTDSWDCVTGSFGGTTYEHCYEARGVVQETETPSGRVQYHYVAHYCARFSIDGEVVSEDCGTHHGLLHLRDGEEQVYHANGKSEFRNEAWGTCTDRWTITYTNGEARHDAYQLECTPSPSDS